VSLRPKVFDLLAYLIGQCDRVVSKQELFDQLWPDVHVGDAALNTCIKAARQAVGDSGHSQAMIRTWHGHGYRFIAPVEERQDERDVRKAAHSPKSEDAPSPDADNLELPDKPSIAVLPFTNMSGDPEQEYFSDGITEDIITELSRFGSIEIVARHSAFVYRDQAIDVKDAGEVLGARYLVQGSLRKAGTRIRLTTQLLDVVTGKQIWAERYDRELEDIFDIQDELVHSVVATLVGRLEADNVKRSLLKRPESLAAYDYYLRALQFDFKMDAESIFEGRRMAEAAVAIAPNFARGHALLAYFSIESAWFEDGDDHAYDDQALEIALKAVELDPDDSMCFAKLGIVHINRHEYDQARYNLEKALSLNPHDFWAWSNYAWYLTIVGEPQQALDRLDRREALEPFSPIWHWKIRARALYGLGRYEEAAAAMEHMASFNYWNHGYLAACYGQLGQADKAREHWAEVVRSVPDAKQTMIAEWEIFKDPADSDHWLQGLQKAKLLE
jgi:TolB-like protein